MSRLRRWVGRQLVGLGNAVAGGDRWRPDIERHDAVLKELREATTALTLANQRRVFVRRPVRRPTTNPYGDAMTRNGWHRKEGPT